MFGSMFPRKYPSELLTWRLYWMPLMFARVSPSDSQSWYWSRYWKMFDSMFRKEYPSELLTWRLYWTLWMFGKVFRFGWLSWYWWRY